MRHEAWKNAAEKQAAAPAPTGAGSVAAAAQPSRVSD